MARPRLAEYEKKRDRKKTPEPFGGKKRGKQPIFVVQRHDARRLHYDFRLERDGALASWAVPKGIPLEPGQRALAVHVEDHPLEYATFEGEIPKGEYGAGPVEIWDNGTYELVEEKRDGGLTVRLHGKRLDGTWTLVPAKLDGNPKNWLILRKREQAAEAPRERRRYRPMLATLAAEVPRGGDWLHEVKWDGYRAIADVRGSNTTLTSRNDNDLTGRFESVAREISRAVKTPDCVLDGEVCALDEQGRATFSAMQQGKDGTRYVYVVFDLLEVDGQPVVDLPLTERRERLLNLLDRRNQNVQFSESFDDGDALFRAAEAQQFEGIVSKRRDSRYELGRRTRNWLKVKTHGRQEFVIAGYTRGQGRREGRFGALILGYWKGDELVYAGNVGTGFSDGEIDRLLRKLRPLERKEPPFETVPKMPKIRKDAIAWVEPKLVAEVEFVEWTHDGRLRAPSYQGLRDDKSTTEVRREEPEPMETEIRKGKRTLKLSNLDKAFWPDEGITKGDLLSYYRDVAGVVVPHLKDRPFTMKRYPDGAFGKFFFQKDAPKHMPDWIKGVEITVTTRDKPRERRKITGAARERRARAPLDGEHGLHRPEYVVLTGRQAGAAGLRPLRPRSVRRRRFRGDRPGRAARQAGARHRRARELPEDERVGRHSRPRPDRAAPHVRRDARVRRDHRVGAGAHALRARDDGVGAAQAARRPHRLEPERRGEDDRLGLLGASAEGGAGVDAASLGRGEREARPERVHDGRGPRADREARRPLRARPPRAAVADGCAEVRACEPGRLELVTDCY